MSLYRKTHSIPTPMGTRQSTKCCAPGCRAPFGDHGPAPYYPCPTGGAVFRKHTKRVCAGQTFSAGEVEVQEMVIKAMLANQPVAHLVKHRSFTRWARKVHTMHARCALEATRLKQLGESEYKQRAKHFEKDKAVSVSPDREEVSKAS